MPDLIPYKFFISYAREDLAVANSIANLLKDAVGPKPTAEIFLDTSLPYGENYIDNLNKELDSTNVLVLVYTGRPKDTYGFPGIELGYFLKLQTDEKIPRRIISFYIEKPPDSVKKMQGLCVGVSREALNRLNVKQYEQGLERDPETAKVVSFINTQRKLATEFRQSQEKGWERPFDDVDVAAIVRTFRVAVFRHLQDMLDPSAELKPQLQIVVTTSGSIDDTDNDRIPEDATIRSVGGGMPLSIFGLATQEVTWKEFLDRTKTNKFGNSWVDAITSVIISALRNQLSVDNTQVILTHDQKTAYRVIMTNGRRYFTGKREFDVLFVGYLNRDDYGNPRTTLLLKGLQLFCRFRFMFLEEESKLSPVAVRASSFKQLTELGMRVERELNLLGRDAVEAALDSPSEWVGLIEANRLEEIGVKWPPIEIKLREVLIQIHKATDDDFKKIRDLFANVLLELQNEIRPINGSIIAEMVDRLKLASKI